MTADSTSTHVGSVPAWSSNRYRLETRVVMVGRQCMRHATIGGLLGLSIVSACMDGEVDDGSDPPAPKTCLDPDISESPVPDWPIVHSTEHLDIHIEEGRFVCAGTALDLERHVEYVSRELGVEVERRIQVYRVDGTAQWCPPGLNGCLTSDGVVFSGLLTLYHEMTHAVVCETRYGAPRVLSEGLAVSFEPMANTSKGDPLEFSELESPEFNGAYYDRKRPRSPSARTIARVPASSSCTMSQMS